MALSRTMQEAIQTKDLGKIYSSFYTILLSDPGFATSKFDEAFQTVEEENIQGFIKMFNGAQFEDESKWTQEYWDILASELMDNFSIERIEFLKKVGKAVYPLIKEKDNSTHTMQEAKKKEMIQLETDFKSNGKLISVVIGVIILLILVIALTR